MQASLRAYRNTVCILWLLEIIAGALYASSLSIPAGVAVPVLSAVLIESALYVAAGFEGIRTRLERVAPAKLASAMTASAVIPFLICTLALGLFAWKPFALLFGLAAVVSFWYVVFPRRPALDLAFVAVVAAAVLAKVFAHVYPAAAPKLRLDFLGQLMWIRLAIGSALLLGRVDLPGGFRFLPTRKDWAVGLRHFAGFAPVAFVLAIGLRFVRVELPHGSWYVVLGAAAAVFVGMLWVVALFEEFFFRGLIQEWIAGWTGRPFLALVVASLLFGAAHLPFRGFPNWRFALLAAVAGLFYGRAYYQARSIRSAMIAHALVNTLWRVFFR